VNRIARYFLDLGFYPSEIEFGTGLPWKRLAWSLAAYVLLFMGLLAQQIIDVTRPPFRLSVDKLDTSVFLASAVVAVALFSLFTHWFNSKREQPSWEHVIWAFSFGFFVHVASSSLVKKLFN
jgi:RsiW-degrading membrane proteinase PrsW (M82 family)